MTTEYLQDKFPQMPRAEEVARDTAKEIEYNHEIFELQDAKGDRFLPPYFAPTTGLGIRNLVTALSNGQLPQVSQFPEDFTLWRCGYWSELQGRVRSCEPELINSVHTILEMYKSDA